MRVFLIHGMGRSRASMVLLRRRLRAAGHDVDSFGYLVHKDSLATIADRFVARVLDVSAGAPYAVVGHSLGNIITRLALPRLAGLSRFVMLAPPNQPPVMARAIGNHPLTQPVFAALTGDAGDKLRDPAFYQELPLPTVPTLVVAGTGGPRARWLPFAGAPSDGVVAVEETHLEGTAQRGDAEAKDAEPSGSWPVEHVEVSAVHTFIMNGADVARLTLSFLEHGTVRAAGADAAVETDGTSR